MFTMLFAFAIAFASACAPVASAAIWNASLPNPLIEYAMATVVTSLITRNGTCAARFPAAGHCPSAAICTIAVLLIEDVGAVNVMGELVPLAVVFWLRVIVSPFTAVTVPPAPLPPTRYPVPTFAALATVIVVAPDANVAVVVEKVTVTPKFSLAVVSWLIAIAVPFTPVTVVPVANPVPVTAIPTVMPVAFDTVIVVRLFRNVAVVENGNAAVAASPGLPPTATMYTCVPCVQV